MWIHVLGVDIWALQDLICQNSVCQESKVSVQPGILQNGCPQCHFVPLFNCCRLLRLFTLLRGKGCVTCWMRRCEPIDCTTPSWVCCPSYWRPVATDWLCTENLLDCNYQCCVLSDSSQGQTLAQMCIPQFGSIVFLGLPAKSCTHLH